MYSAALVGLKVKNQLRASRMVASRRRSYSFRIRSASSCLPISFSPCRFDDFLDSSALAMHSFERFRRTAAFTSLPGFYRLPAPRQSGATHLAWENRSTHDSRDDITA